MAAWRALAAASVLSLLLAAALYGLAGGGGTSHLSQARVAPPSRAVPLSLAAAAQGPVSAAIGAGERRYWMSASRTGFDAASPAQRMHLRFAGSSVSVASGALAERLRLRAVGSAGSLAPVGPARVSARANALSYRRGSLTEWYRNGPLGLEQGFTLAHAPARAATGPLTLALALQGNARLALAPDGRSITLSHYGARALRYGSLSATDAGGRSLPSSLELHGNTLLLRVDARGARYPLRIDPFIQQAKLQAANERGAGHLGRSVALSADGDTALIGVPHEHALAGVALVFTRSGSSWSEQATLKSPGVAGNAFFGRAVALSADGNVALIGAPGEQEEPGAAAVFSRSGSTWTEEAALKASDEVGGGRFGRSVSLSAAGDTALIGGYGDSAGVGAAWVFAREGGGWAQQGAKLQGAGEVGNGRFGRSVALSGDGATALIGAPYDARPRGAAWVFTRAGSAWAQQGSKLAARDEVGTGLFGGSVSLSSSGSVALIAGAQDAAGSGAAWVFERSGSNWSQPGPKLTGAGEVGAGLFGTSVALSSDASTVLVGGLADNGGVGAAWAFTRAGGAWNAQTPKLTASEEVGEGQFGWSVALSADGLTALIGGLADNLNVGAAWVFTREVEPVSEPKTTSNGTTQTTTENKTFTPIGGVAPFISSANPTLAPPVLAQTGNISLFSGNVLIKLPGSSSFVVLKGSAHIPFGTTIDASHGTVTVTTTGPHGGTQTGRFFGGVFVLTQDSKGMVVATLTGGSFSSCPKKHAKHASVHGARTARAHSARKRPVRKLWSNAHGSFSTKGNFAAGAVQGTEWLTEDFCEGTLIVVTRDRVKVTDLVHHHTIVVKVGHRYFAKAK